MSVRVFSKLYMVPWIICVYSWVSGPICSMWSLWFMLLVFPHGPFIFTNEGLDSLIYVACMFLLQLKKFFAPAAFSWMGSDCRFYINVWGVWMSLSGLISGHWTCWLTGDNLPVLLKKEDFIPFSLNWRYLFSIVSSLVRAAFSPVHLPLPAAPPHRHPAPSPVYCGDFKPIYLPVESFPNQILHILLSVVSNIAWG